MADSKITQLTANTTPATTDLLPMVDDPGGTPLTQYITFQNFLKVINSLTADGTPDTAADYLLSYDASAGTVKKVLMNLVGSSNGTNPNVLPNGGFRVATRGDGSFTSASSIVNNDDAYLLDGCIFLADGADTCDVSRVADTDFVSGYKIRMDVETANRRFGVLFPVENKDIQDIRKSGKASLQFKVKCTGTSMSNVRAYVLSWDGTADSITSDVISAWGSAGANPTFVANWTAENTASNLAISTTVATKTIENITVDTASVANLAVLIIVDDTDATVGDFLEIGDVKLETGTTCTSYINNSIVDNVSACRRYLKLISYTGAGRAESTTQANLISPLDTPFRSAPSGSVFGTIKVRDITVGVTKTATTPSVAVTAVTDAFYVEVSAASWAAANFTAGNAVALFCDAGNGILLSAEL